VAIDWQREEIRRGYTSLAEAGVCQSLRKGIRVEVGMKKKSDKLPGLMLMATKVRMTTILKTGSRDVKRGKFRIQNYGIV
jgi:hypothetical protein